MTMKPARLLLWVVVLVAVLAILEYVQVKVGRLGVPGTCGIPEGGGVCAGTEPLILLENESYVEARINLSPGSLIGSPQAASPILQPNPDGTGVAVLDDSEAAPGGSPIFSKEPPKEIAPLEEPSPRRAANLGIRKKLYLFNATGVMANPHQLAVTVGVAASADAGSFPRATASLYQTTTSHTGAWRVCNQAVSPCTGQELWNVSAGAGYPMNLQLLSSVTLFDGRAVAPGTMQTGILTALRPGDALFTPLDRTAFVVAYRYSQDMAPGVLEPTPNITAWPLWYPTDILPLVGGQPGEVLPGEHRTPVQTADIAPLANVFCQRPAVLAACTIPVGFNASGAGILDYVADTTSEWYQCTSAWNCTAWTACAITPNGTGSQVRTCVDLNACDPPTSDRPAEEQECVLPGPDCHDVDECTGLNMTECADNATIHSCEQVNASCLAWVNESCGPQSVCIPEVLAISGACYYYGPPQSGGGGGGGGGGGIVYVKIPEKKCPGPDCPVLTSLAWVTKLPGAFPWALLIGATGLLWYLERSRRRR